LKKALIAAAAAGVIVGGGVAASVTAAVTGGPSGAPSGGPTASQTPSPSGSQGGGESPPDCVTVAISENSGNGPVLWTKWCGTGSRGAAPMKARTGQLVVDGALLDPANCTQASPCVILWPRSPKS
jgi:hypothetical protein